MLVQKMNVLPYTTAAEKSSSTFLLKFMKKMKARAGLQRVSPPLINSSHQRRNSLFHANFLHPAVNASPQVTIKKELIGEKWWRRELHPRPKMLSAKRLHT